MHKATQLPPTRPPAARSITPSQVIRTVLDVTGCMGHRMRRVFEGGVTLWDAHPSPRELTILADGDYVRCRLSGDSDSIIYPQDNDELTDLVTDWLLSNPSLT